MSGPASSFHSWPNLPTELQLEVLSHVLVASSALYHAIFKQRRDNTQSSDDRYEVLEQLNACIGTRNRHLADLAQQVYYEENVFLIGLVAGPRYSPESRPVLFRPNLARMHAVRHVRLSMYHASFPMDMNHAGDMIDSKESWKFLLQPRQTVSGAGLRDVAWQSKLTNLHTVQVLISFTGTGVVQRQKLSNYPVEFTAMLGILENAHIPLKARDVSVDFFYPANRRVPQSTERDSVVERLKAMMTVQK